MAKFLDKKFCFNREFFRKEFVPDVFPEKIYSNFHYTGDNYGT